MRHYFKIGLITIGTLFASACSNTKYIPAGDSLYIGSDVSIKDKQVAKSDRKIIKNDLEDAIRPKPNTKTLGMRLKLTMYNLAGEPKKPKGIRNWLRNKVGEPPVLTSQFDINKNKQLLVNILENRGFFYPEVSGESKTKNRKGIVFKISAEAPLALFF